MTSEKDDVRASTAVVTVSDGVYAGARHDESGLVAERLLGIHGYRVLERRVVPDDHATIVTTVRELVASGITLVVTSGGTGFGPRDVTPEATREVIEREAPGLPELMRSAGVTHTPMAALSRGVAGTVGSSLIINLPGSPKAVKESLEAVIPVLHHALLTLAGHTQHSGAVTPTEGRPPTE